MIWNEINTEQEVNAFLELYGYFHDSCLKELRYISGAFVNEKLEMYPKNDERKYMLYSKDKTKTYQPSRLNLLV